MENKEKKYAILSYTGENGKQVEFSMENFIIAYNDGSSFGCKRRMENREDIFVLLGLYHGLREMIKRIEDENPSIRSLDELAIAFGAYEKSSGNESAENTLFKK